MEFSFEKYLLEFKKPSGTSRGILYNKPSWIFKITDDNGISGVGEFSVIPGLSPDYEDEKSYEIQIQKAIDFLKQAFNNTSETESLIREFIAKFKDFPSLIFGVETALLDLKNGGREIIFDNNFSKGNKSIPINGLIWMGSEDEMQTQIDEKLRLGFKTIKLKIGAIDVNKELSLIQNIRKSYNSDEITIRVDANGAFSFEESQDVLLKLKDLDVHSIEQPIKAGQWHQMMKLSKENIIPIALDEELIGVNEKLEKIKLLDLIKPQYIILKPSLHGGITGCSEWIELAEQRKIGWWMTSALESSIGLNAIVQFTANYNVRIPQGLGTGGLYTNNLPSKLVIKEGFLKLEK